MELFFDTETSSMVDWKGSHEAPHQPDIIQLAGILSTKDKVFAEFNFILNPSTISPNWKMDSGAEAVHGISTETVLTTGVDSILVLEIFERLVTQADVVICHNTSFDFKLLDVACYRAGRSIKITNSYCTMQNSTNLCKLPSPHGYKWPKLSELHQYLFNEDFDGAHDALNDIRATRRCYYAMKERGL